MRESPKSAALRKRRVPLPKLVSDDSYAIRERFLLGRYEEVFIERVDHDDAGAWRSGVPGLRERFEVGSFP
jgi:hypothetical protein